MKKYIHIAINIFFLSYFLILLVLTRRGCFTVSERLRIIDIVGVVFVFIVCHILLIGFVVNQLKWMSLFISIITLIVCIYFNGEFNPF